jgi:hypothetical protein
MQSVCMAFSLLPVLRPGDWRATICVRVCRKWEYRGGTDDGPIQHVDLVLVDEKVCLFTVMCTFTFTNSIVFSKSWCARCLPVMLHRHAHMLNQC